MTPATGFALVAILAAPLSLHGQQPPTVSVQTGFAVKAPGPVFTLYRQPDGDLACDLEVLPEWEEVIVYRRDGDSLVVDPGGPKERLVSITLDLTGFTPQAEVAFQFAVAIWGAALDGTVPIKVQASYAAIDGPSGTVAFAGADGLFRDFGGAGVAGTFYPAALADQLAGFDLSPSSNDVTATFDSSENWYLGTDGNPGPGQIDFVTVVLHELGHGLGFFASDDVDGTGSGSFGFGAGNRPAIFDLFIEDGAGNLMTAETNPSQSLGSFLTSGDVFFDGPQVVVGNGGPGRLYAPDPYRPGSSISHWDPAVFPPTSINGVMGPSVLGGAANHDPGPLTLALFEDLGWTLDTGGPSNQAPIASAGADQTVNEGDPVTLDAAGSVDPNGDPLTFSWTQLAGPPVSLSGASTASASFTAPSVTQSTILTFRVTVDDGQLSASDTVTVTVQDNNRRPSANAGPNQTVSTGQVVQLAGSASDPDGDPLSLFWTQLSSPPDDSVTLAGGATLTPSFTAPSSAQSLTFRLTASDGSLTDTDTVTITVAATGMPNLKPQTPSGWPSPLRFSTQAGDQPEPDSFLVGNEVFVDWAVFNDGSAATSESYQVQLFVDGEWYATRVVTAGHQPGTFIIENDLSLGQLGPGSHSIRVFADAPGHLAESNETDNEFTRELLIETEPCPTLVFPQFADGISGGFANRSRIILRNPSNFADTGLLRFLDAAGDAQTVGTGLGQGAEFPYSIPPWGSMELQTLGEGPLKTGVIAVSSDLDESALVGTEVFSILGSFVSVQSAVCRTSHQIYISVDDSENTGLAIFSPARQDVEIDLVLLDEQGVERAARTIVIPAGGQLVRFITEESLLQDFFATLPPGATFRGTLQLRVLNGAKAGVVALLQKSTGELIAVETTELP